MSSLRRRQKGLKIRIFFKKYVKLFQKNTKFLNKKVTLTLLLSNNQNIKKLNKVFRKINLPIYYLSIR